MSAADLYQRALDLKTAVRQLASDLHTAECRAPSSDGMAHWRLRGAEVHAQIAGDLLWATACTLAPEVPEADGAPL